MVDVEKECEGCHIKSNDFTQHVAGCPWWLARAESQGAASTSAEEPVAWRMKGNEGAKTWSAANAWTTTSQKEIDLLLAEGFVCQKLYTRPAATPEAETAHEGKDGVTADHIDVLRSAAGKHLFSLRAQLREYDPESIGYAAMKFEADNIDAAISASAQGVEHG